MTTPFESNLESKLVEVYDSYSNLSGVPLDLVTINCSGYEAYIELSLNDRATIVIGPVVFVVNLRGDLKYRAKSLVAYIRNFIDFKEADISVSSRACRLEGVTA